MKFDKPIHVDEIAKEIGAEIRGNENALVYGMNEIHNVEEGDLTFVDFERYYKFTLQSEASIIIIDQEVEAPAGKTLLLTTEPFPAYNKLAKKYRKVEVQKETIHPSAKIGEGTDINDGCVIGKNVIIGKRCKLGHNAVIHDGCILGDKVTVHSNSVIGSDAFYYKRWEGKSPQYEKMHSVGKVIIEDNVEIGSNCSVDRGVSANTIIGRGTKIDNNTQIGHEVKIGHDCLISAQVGIAGNVIIGNNVKVWGQAGISKNLRITDNVEILAQSGVARSITLAGKYFGSPAAPAKQKMREMKTLERLTTLWKDFLIKMSE